MSDDDWDTDPDFVNDVSEKQQRWGNKGSTVATRVTVLSLHLSFCLSWCASFSYIFYVRGCLCGFMCMCVSGMCVRARVYFFMRTCAHIRVCFNVCVCVCVLCATKTRQIQTKTSKTVLKTFWRCQLVLLSCTWHPRSSCCLKSTQEFAHMCQLNV